MPIGEVPVRFLRVAEPFEVKVGGRTFVDLTEWEAANGDPEVGRWFRDLKRTGKLAVRMRLARQIAERHLTAGIFQAPPKMVDNITNLAMGAVSALELSDVEEKLAYWTETHKEAKKKVKSFGPVAKKVGQIISEAPGLRKEYLAYKEAAEHPAAKAVAGYGGRIMPIKQGEFSSIRKSGDLAEWWAAEKSSFEELMGWWVDGMKNSVDESREKRKQIQKYLRSNVSPKIDQVLDVPVDLEGWRYGDIASKLDKVRDKQVKDFQTVLQQAQEVGKSVDIFKNLVENAKKTWKTIRVRLVIEMGIKEAAGMWQPGTKTLTVKLPRRIDQIEAVRTTVRHELQHMAQSLMTDAVKGFDYWGPGVAGRPSKGIQTPWFSQTQDESFVKHDPEKYPKAEREKAQRRLLSLGVDRAYLRGFSFHTVDDIEFVTRLADDIEFFQKMVGNGTVKDLKAAIRVFTFASTSSSDRETAGPLVSVSKFFRNMKLATPGKWKEAVKQLIKVVL